MFAATNVLLANFHVPCSNVVNVSIHFSIDSTYDTYMSTDFLTSNVAFKVNYNCFTRKLVANMLLHFLVDQENFVRYPVTLTLLCGIHCCQLVSL